MEATEMGMVEVNGTQLYYERHGSGATLLLIPGAEGDAEEFLRVAQLLDTRFTVLRYDRRGFSRCSWPGDRTTVEQQGDDAAALLTALDLAPALVWGNSSGAIIGLDLMLRHPGVVAKAMLHEPPLFAGMSDPAQVRASLEQATAQGKVPFLRALTGDEVYYGLSEGYRSRLESDQTWISCEFDVFEYYRPTDEDLAALSRPVAVLYGSDSPPFFGEAARWLAARLGTEATMIPGGHGAHYDKPDEVAKAISAFVEG